MENKSFNVDEFFTKKLEEVKRQELPTDNKKSKKKKNKKKGNIIGAIAGVMAGVALLTSALWPRKNNKNKAPQETTNPSIIQEDQNEIGDLGFIYDEPNSQTNKPQYGNTTGDINKDNLVEQDGTIWVDQEAANNSSNIGNEQVDTQNGTLVVQPNGDVIENEQGYEVQDPNGNVVGEGSNSTGVPAGYAWDEVLGKYVREEDVGKYVYADATYYAADGTVVIEKGDIVLKETLQRVKEQCTTTKPQTETQPTQPTEPEETVVVDEGVINPDGTYTIYGVTYMSKEDYQQFLLHPEQYGFYNGMVLSLGDIEALFNQNQKTK